MTLLFKVFADLKILELEGLKKWFQPHVFYIRKIVKGLHRIAGQQLLVEWMNEKTKVHTQMF